MTSGCSVLLGMFLVVGGGTVVLVVLFPIQLDSMICAGWVELVLAQLRFLMLVVWWGMSVLWDRLCHSGCWIVKILRFFDEKF